MCMKDETLNRFSDASRMSSAIQTSPNAFTKTPPHRLTSYLAKHKTARKSDIVALTPDASTREYFRVPWNHGTAVAAVYPEPFDPEVHPYLDVTRLFLAADIPVPEIYAVGGEEGIIVQEDLGDRQLFRFYETADEEECEEFKERAITLIARIQKATAKATEMQSIASRLAFDEAKLSGEWGFVVEHVFA